MKILFVGFDKENDTLALVAQEGNRWYRAHVFEDYAEWVQDKKPDFELTHIRDIPTPSRDPVEF